MNNPAKTTDAADIIATLFPKEVTGIILPIGDYQSHLYPEECSIVESASDKRKFEFSTGRWCAKQVLNAEGVQNFPVLSGENRDPIWPDNIVGSISHCKDLCGAVIAKSNNVDSIGFDIENIKKLKNDIAKIVCVSSEKDWIRKNPQHSYNTLVLLIFSLKEAVYKNVYHYQKIRLGFKDCEIVPNFINGTADIIFNKQNIQQDVSLKFLISEGHIYSSAISFS